LLIFQNSVKNPKNLTDEANMKKFTVAFMGLLLLPTFAAAGKVNTPDYYKCFNRVGGEWAFGRAPNGCDASAFGDDKTALATFGPLVFRDNQERNTERQRYMDDLHAVIRDAAEYYIKKRKPNASKEEVEAFKLGALTTANQESYWSHYRIPADGRLKQMRGDFGHGHGIMQLDDRWHYPAITQGTAWNLMGNITYGLDEFYQNWERAATQRCVTSSSNMWQARIRSAWSAYNGGATRLCRWTNPNDRWERNDRGFFQKLRNKDWQDLVKNFNKPAPINVPCLLEKRENCPAPGEPTTPTLRENVLYRTVAGKPCVFRAGTLQCLGEFKDHLCLRSISRYGNSTAEVLSDEATRGVPTRDLDRHSTCRAYEPTLIAVGKMIEANQDIFVRSTPGGGRLGVLQRGDVVEVLDFEIRSAPENDRYYRVNAEGTIGFIYAGSKTNQGQWVALSNRRSPLPPVVARPDDTIQVVNPAGINLRVAPSGALLGNIPNGARLVVVDYLISGEDNHVYYLVSYRGRIGYLYSGTILPRNTVDRWTVRVR
jgi:hypothetical protein